MNKAGPVIKVGEFLRVGDYIQSPNGYYYAIMQEDGNLSVYRGTSPSDNQGYVWSWSHQALPLGPYYAIVQEDGNLCVYRGAGPSDNQGGVWSWSHQSLPLGQYFTIMQDDGGDFIECSQIAAVPRTGGRLDAFVAKYGVGYTLEYRGGLHHAWRPPQKPTAAVSIR
jgi:hypothetical protein